MKRIIYSGITKTILALLLLFCCIATAHYGFLTLRAPVLYGTSDTVYETRQYSELCLIEQSGSTFNSGIRKVSNEHRHCKAYSTYDTDTCNEQIRNAVAGTLSHNQGRMPHYRQLYRHALLRRKANAAQYYRFAHSTWRYYRNELFIIFF